MICPNCSEPLEADPDGLWCPRCEECFPDPEDFVDDWLEEIV